ncbi:putative molybdenum/thiazole biosynthesis cofactor [Ixodes scapularis]
MQSASSALPLDVPLECLEEGAIAVVEKLRESGSKEVLVVCRRGNDSQLAVQKLKKLLGDHGDVTCTVRDIQGGLESWAQTVDPSFPTY